jgi:hypothetical protein
MGPKEIVLATGVDKNTVKQRLYDVMDGRVSKLGGANIRSMTTAPARKMRAYRSDESDDFTVFAVTFWLCTARRKKFQPIARRRLGRCQRIYNPSFSASRINVLRSHVATVSRPHYIRGHGNRQNYRASSKPAASA